MISKKKVFDLPQTDLSVSFDRPYEAIGPSDEPHDGLPKLHGGPGVIVLLCPSRRPWPGEAAAELSLARLGDYFLLS